MKTATRKNKDTWIIDVKEEHFQGRRLVTQEEWVKGWIWDGAQIERMIIDEMKDNQRRSNV
jgi:hypothetical protein